MTGSLDMPAEEIAVLGAIASVGFKPWQHVPDEWQPPSNAEWSEYAADLLPPARLAWVTMYKTKDELETIARELSGEPFEVLMKGIINAHKFFGDFARLLKAAEMRIMSAAHAVEFRATLDRPPTPTAGKRAA